MGKSAAETVREIEDTRDKLESEIRELEGRLPHPAVWTKRLIGVAVGAMVELLLPGHHASELVLAMLLGIAGALLAWTPSLLVFAWIVRDIRNTRGELD